MSENKVIIPTIGRRVWFWPAGLRRTEVVCNNPNVPMDAGIVYVWGDRMVNLDVTDHAGNHHAFTSVSLWHGDGDRPNGAYCEWMPYQKGQASKPDDIKALVDAAVRDWFKPETVLRIVPDLAAVERGELGREDLLNFGQALDLLKDGVRLARIGWNGKGMFVYYVPAASYPAQTGAAKAHFGEGAMVPYNAYLALKGVDGNISTWVPSINDVLAEDWVVVQ